MFCCADDLSEDEEPDFTSPKGVSEQLLKDDDAEIAGAEDGGKDLVEETFVFARKYEPSDLYPTVKDPACDPKWMLSSYWPVYVSNFKAQDWEEETWCEQVSDYFAYKGLLTRMIYFHQIEDEIFLEFQKKSQLLDMLVYFTCREDAENAIKTSHRDSYYGYYLNVFHGRQPEYFANERTVRLEVSIQKSTSETFIENKLKSFGKIEVVSKTSPDHAYVQFASVKDMLSAVGNQYLWRPYPLKNPVMKQRFVEGEVKMGIEWSMQSNDTFMDMQPSPEVLLSLLDGFRPKVETDWQGHKLPVLTVYSKQRRKQSRERMKVLAKKSRIDKTIHKSKVCKAAVKTLRDPDSEVPGQISDTPAASASREPQQRRTHKEKIADTLKTVNWFLRIHGQPPVSRTIINARLEQNRKKKN